MKLRSAICSIGALLLFFHIASAQKVFTASPLSAASRPALRDHFTRYSVFSINTAEIAEYSKARKSGKAEFTLELPGLTNWQLSISEHDILSRDYKLVVNGAGGTTVYPRPACMTFAGYLSDKANSKVRLTIDNEVIYGIIKSNDREYFIEPLQYLDRNANGGEFVVYETADVKFTPGLSCGVTEAYQRGEAVQREMAGTNCVQTELAIASDESMYLRYGSAADVQTHNIGVMNNVIWDYVNAQFTDNVEFVIVTQNVSTSAATDQLSPAYTGTNSNTILANFRTWGNAGNFGISYDLAQFWTTRNIDNDGAGGGSGTIGLAYVSGGGVVCGASRYHILEDFTGTVPTGSGYQLRVLTSHEIGHNFGCSHDGAGSGFIMAPSVNNTSTWSAASVSTLNSNVPGMGCLAGCSAAGVPIASFIAVPEAICTGGTLQLTDHSLRGPTSWSWTMTGGSPASSTSRNPTVSYAGNGPHLVTLTSTNANGSSTAYSNYFLVSSSPATACSNTGALATEGGVKSFTLNNINRISGSSNADGNKYMDFSCSDVTSLVANTNYTVSVNVGQFSATDPTPPHIFNLVQLFIDYNNDGDFTDPGEAVYSSPSCYVGTHSFSFTTIASPPVTNQFLRLRVIAKNCVGGVNSCYNVTTGQVEDYSVFFESGIMLPVTLLDFAGYHDNGLNVLSWETATEQGASHFDIERSTDGSSFVPIGRKTGNVNSSAVAKYEFTDPLINGYANYPVLHYRLKMVDISGKSEYSKVISIAKKPSAGELVLSLQPNPFSNQFAAMLQMKTAGTVTMQLTDLSGRIILTEQKKLGAGIQTISYKNFERLAKGAYIIRISDGQEAYSRLIEKQ